MRRSIADHAVGEGAAVEVGPDVVEEEVEQAVVVEAPRSRGSGEGEAVAELVDQGRLLVGRANSRALSRIERPSGRAAIGGPSARSMASTRSRLAKAQPRRRRCRARRRSAAPPRPRSRRDIRRQRAREARSLCGTNGSGGAVGTADEQGPRRQQRAIGAFRSSRFPLQRPRAPPDPGSEWSSEAPNIARCRARHRAGGPLRKAASRTFLTRPGRHRTS